MGLIALITASLCVAGAAYDDDLAPRFCPARTGANETLEDGNDLTADDFASEFGTGFPRTRLRFADRFRKCRDEQLKKATPTLVELEKAMRAVDREKKGAVEAKLTALAGEALDKAGGALLEAVRCETKRLGMIQKAAERARKEGKQPLDVDLKTVARLRKRYESGQVEKIVQSYIAGLRLVSQGLMVYFKGDLTGAVAKMKAASAECPNLAVAFIYLGSISYLMGQGDTAFPAWWTVLKLEPENEVVRRTLRELGSSGLGPQQ